MSVDAQRTKLPRSFEGAATRERFQTSQADAGSSLRLQLFGGLQWIIGARALPVVGLRRTDILLTLVEQHGTTVSADQLLDRVWKTRPASGRNAVQRHISALRQQLIGLVEDPAVIIESQPGGYRLSAVTETDMSLLVSGHDNDLVRWWDRPLGGVDPADHAALVTRLENLASAAFEKWSRDPAISTEVQRTRLRSMLAHSPHTTRNVTELGRINRDLRQPQDEVVTSVGKDLLQSCIGLWSAGSTPQALDTLEQSDALPHDLRHRLYRWLIWLEPDDPWARYCLSLLLRESIIDPTNLERSIVTVDARCFALMEDGWDLAQSEVGEMATARLKVRALRVQFMLGLTAPCSPRQGKIIAEIETFDLPDAFVEAPRFRFLECVRTGNYEQAQQELEGYQGAVEEHWDGLGDDFAPMALAALQRSIDPRLAGFFGVPTPTLGAFSDTKLLPVANTIRNLLVRSPAEPLSDAELAEAASGMTPDAIRAMYLLRDMNTGRRVHAEAEAMAAELPAMARTRQFHLMPVALAVVAEALQHREIAMAARTALEPWTGQMLGIWPIDFVFGPAEDWIRRLNAI